MQAKLNGEFEKKPEGKYRRGKRTRAKEHVYQHIYDQIKLLYPGYQFNPGVNTAVNPEVEFRWTAPYRHWLFVPKANERNPDYIPRSAK